MGQLTSIHRYFSDFLGGLGCIASFLSEKAAVTIVTINSFAQNSQIYWWKLLGIFRWILKFLLHYGKACSAFGLEAVSINGGEDVRLKSPQIRRFSVTVSDVRSFFLWQQHHTLLFMASSITSLLQVLYNTLDGKQSLQKHEISTGIHHPTIKHFSFLFFLLQSWPQFGILVFLNVQHWYLLSRILFTLKMGWE